MPAKSHPAAFQPEQIEAMHLAYEKACAAMRPQGPTDAVNDLVATKIVEFAKAGELDPERLCRRTLEHFGVVC